MLDATVSRALSTDPERRYRSAAEMRAALEAALHEPAPSYTPRKLVARGLASAIALSVIGLVGAVALHSPLRARAVSALSPVLNEAQALRLRAAEHMHAAQPQNAALAQVEPAKVDPAAAAVVEIKAAEPEPAQPVAPSPTPSTELATANAAAPSDDGEVEDDSASSDSPQPEKAASASASEASANGEKAIAEAHELAAKGNKLKALNVLRRAAKKVPTDAKVLQELATAAEENRAWGEATRAARHWVAVEPSAESKLELARLERKTGHRERALELVRSVVKDNPDSPEAHAMLSQLGGSERVAMQK